MKNNINNAIEALADGQVVAVPTETVYGLAVDAANGDAVAKLYALKQRANENPLQLMAASLELAQLIGLFDKKAVEVAEKFWPGPLTVVVKKRPGAQLADNISQNDTIGIRIPAHPVMQELLAAYGRPLATTSANISGQASALTVEEVRNIFGTAAISCVLDNPETPHGTASSVVDMTGDTPKLLREGGITLEMIEETLSKAP